MYNIVYCKKIIQMKRKNAHCLFVCFLQDDANNVRNKFRVVRVWWRKNINNNLDFGYFFFFIFEKTNQIYFVPKNSASKIDQTIWKVEKCIFLNVCLFYQKTLMSHVYKYRCIVFVVNVRGHNARNETNFSNMFVLAWIHTTTRSGIDLNRKKVNKLNKIKINNNRIILFICLLFVCNLKELEMKHSLRGWTWYMMSYFVVVVVVFSQHLHKIEVFCALLP